MAYKAGEEQDNNFQETFDVIVVGYGFAGALAALSAAAGGC